MDQQLKELEDVTIYLMRQGAPSADVMKNVNSFVLRVWTIDAVCYFVQGFLIVFLWGRGSVFLPVAFTVWQLRGTLATITFYRKVTRIIHDR